LSVSRVYIHQNEAVPSLDLYLKNAKGLLLQQKRISIIFRIIKKYRI